ncbi:MAG: molybdate ABC transporter substrate-binding protein [Acidobacteria bacterium]|nr:molybdate ABC transporter substrate-binding protein [Acidobacteriota bacterium]
MRHALLLLAFATPTSAAELLIACASDLAPAQPALTAAFRQATGHTIRFTTGSSGMLARQIANGAPFDLFLSANRAYIDSLASQSAVRPDSIRLYAKGRLALYPQKTLNELRDPKIRHIAIPNPKHAPYGVAAQQALEKAGLWKLLEPKIVYAENVRQALQYAESGNADAVLTSHTLLQGKGALLPENLHQPILQAAAITTATRQQTLAARFLDFLTSAPGAAILRQNGLTAPVP